MLSNNDILPNFSVTFGIFHINVPSWETCRMSSMVCRIDVISWERISWVGWSPCMDALCSSTPDLRIVKPLSKPLTCVVISDECWLRRWASPLSASIPKARTSTVSETSCKCSTRCFAERSRFNSRELWKGIHIHSRLSFSWIYRYRESQTMNKSHESTLMLQASEVFWHLNANNLKK